MRGVILLLLCSCSTLHNSARDPDAQLALKGISKAFKQYGLYQSDLEQDLNALDWKLYIRDYKEPLNCGNAEACTTFNLRNNTLVIELPNYNIMEGCPRVSKLFIHELYHVALKLSQRFSDPTHIDDNWKQVAFLQQTYNPCKSE
jgi:hypothetical protein